MSVIKDQEKAAKKLNLLPLVFINSASLNTAYANIKFTIKLAINFTNSILFMISPMDNNYKSKNIGFHQPVHIELS